MRSTIAAISIFVAALVLPNAASASFTIGTEAPGPSPSIGCSAGFSCEQVLISQPGVQVVSPAAGVVTRVRMHYNGAYVRGAIRVLRDAGAGSFLNVREAAVSFPSAFTDQVPITFSTRLPIGAGDRIGLGWSVAVSPEFAVTYGTGSTGGSANGSIAPHEPGTTKTYTTTSGGAALLSTVEPDADRDGFGDESQDACPISAARQTPCPAPIVRLLKSGTLRFSKLTIIESVSADATVVSKASIKVGKKTLTSKFVTKSLTAGVAASFKFSFTKSANKAINKALKDGKKLEATVTSTASDAFGASTATQTIKLKV